LGLAFRLNNQYEKALTSLKNAIRIDPKRASAHQSMGTTLAKLGRYEEALVSYKQAIAINPKKGQTYGKMGTTLRKMGKH